MGDVGPPSVSIDPVQPLQPRLHGLLQVVAGVAELGVAAGDELLLLALHRMRLAQVRGFADRADIRRIDLAVGLGRDVTGLTGAARRDSTTRGSR